MKLRIISVGHKMPSWVETACAEYTKRMPREIAVEIVDIKPEKRAAGNSADGLHTSVKQKADWKLAISKLTLPHAMVRVLLAEQLYRAHSVIINHPYHRE